jgi:hypothetical protein
MSAIIRDLDPANQAMIERVNRCLHELSLPRSHGSRCNRREIVKTRQIKSKQL